MKRALISPQAFDRAGWLAAGGAAILLIALLTGVVRAGPLDPAGPPSSTMKALDVIEPRTPIPSLPFTITESGSYYLTGNLTAASATDNITIAADDVTLDLGGFYLEGAGVGVDGIKLNGPHYDITIRAGTVRGWTGKGLDLTNVVSGALAGIQSVANNVGIDAANMTLSGCTAASNTTVGVRATSATIIGCVSTLNQTGFDLTRSALDASGANNNIGRGISAYQSSIRDCTADFNGSFGIDATSSLVERCAVSSNAAGIAARSGSNIRANTITSSKGDGIDILGGTAMTSITDNVISASGTVLLSAIGIYVGSNDNRIARNTVTGSKSTGIYVSGSFNTIDENTSSGNGGFGIAVAGLKATVVRNTASGNTGGNYSIGAGNNPAPVDAASTSSNPWANTQ